MAKRVLVLVHPHYRPDRGPRRHGTERDVWRALLRLGYRVEIQPALENMREIECKLKEFKPHIVFNLLEEFRNEAVFDFNVIAYLESLGIPFTGCNPRGLILSRNKILVGHVAAALGVGVPRGYLYPKGKLTFPLFVKFNREHASLGIRQSNRVANGLQLRRECARLRHLHRGEILVQEFIAGEDVSVATWGNRSLQVMSPRRLSSKGLVASERLKFSTAFQRKKRVRSMEFRSQLVNTMQTQVRGLYRALDLSGYARFDFRVSEQAYLIDVNANPNLAANEDFCLSARALGYDYLDVIERILQIGMSYRPNV